MGTPHTQTSLDLTTSKMPSPVGNYVPQSTIGMPRPHVTTTVGTAMAQLPTSSGNSAPVKVVMPTGSPRGNRFAPSTDMSQKNIMTAILQAKGPIVNQQALRCSFKFLRHLTAKPFLSAATNLQKLGLGLVITCGFSKYFMKKPPLEVANILVGRPELCTMGYYKERYSMPTSPVITESMRTRLVKAGLVPPDYFQHPFHKK